MPKKLEFYIIAHTRTCDLGVSDLYAVNKREWKWVCQDVQKCRPLKCRVIKLKEVPL